MYRWIILSIFIVFTFLKQTYFQFFTNINEGSIFEHTNFLMLLGLLSFTLLTTASFSWASSKRLLKIAMVLSVFISALLFSDTLYYRYYNNAMTPELIYQLGLVDTIGDSVTSLIGAIDFLFFLDIPIYILLITIAKKRPDAFDRTGKKYVSSAIFSSAGALLLLLVSLSMPFELFRFDNIYTIKRMGISYFHTVSTAEFIVDAIPFKKPAEPEELEEIEQVLAEKKEGSFYHGIAKGKNLIILQLEAIQHFLIDLEVNGVEVTPNLNSFRKGCAYFDDLYYQTAGGNTSDAEFLMNTSLYPADEGAVYFIYSHNKYYSLPDILHKQGYSTFSFHSNRPDYWNRSDMHDNLGFEIYFDENSFEQDKIIGWGLADDSFYMQLLDKFDQSKPFYSFIVSLSSHYPFDFFSDHDFDTTGIEDELMANYLKAANYADAAFGLLIRELKDRELFDSSLIVVYGDHQAIPRNKISSFEELFKKEISDVEWLRLQRVPAMISCEGIEPQTIDTVSGQIDLMPTVLNLMGLENSDCLGRDLFNKDSGYAILRNGTIVTDEFLFLSNENMVYDHSGDLMDMELYEEKILDLQKELEVSDLILKRNYFDKSTKLGVSSDSLPGS